LSIKIKILVIDEAAMQKICQYICTPGPMHLISSIIEISWKCKNALPKKGVFYPPCPTVCITRWAGRENANLPEPISSHTDPLEITQNPGCPLHAVLGNLLIYQNAALKMSSRF
jgi:hypothetical protein